PSIGGASDAATFSRTGPMVTPRSSFNAVSLPDGRAFIIGGAASICQAHQAGIYDSATGQISSAGSMRNGFCTATLLADGRVLVAGCVAGGVPNQIFNPATNQFSNTGALPDAEVTGYNPALSVLLPSNKVLLAEGGNNDGSGLRAGGEVYDPKTGKFSFADAGNTSCSGFGGAVTLLPSGKVLITGGSSFFDGSGGDLNCADLYDPLANNWSIVGPLTTTRVNHISTLLDSGQVLLAGGRAATAVAHGSAELFNPRTGKFTRVADMTNARTEH